MNLADGFHLPRGTSVYCCPRGLVLDLTWTSRIGRHIVRMEVSREDCQPARSSTLAAAAERFRRAVATELRLG